MRRVVQETGAGMVVGMLQEGLVGDAIVQVFTGVDLVTEVDAIAIEFV